MQYGYVYLDFMFHLIANKQVNRHNPILFQECVKKLSKFIYKKNLKGGVEP